ncbi:MAG: alpha/beta fold hydrolase [Pseudomonadota bacterium]
MIRGAGRAVRWAAAILILGPLGAWAGEPVMIPVGGGALRGTLELPDNAHAAVLIIAGSGPTDRDGNVTGMVGKNNSLRYLAEALAEAGVASLRFDKRMIGRSTVRGLTEDDLRFDTYVQDARLWYAELKKRAGVPTFVLGHSEGGLIGTLAAEATDARGLIIVAGAGRSAPDLILEQTRQQLPPALMKQTEEIVAALSAGQTVGDPPPMLAALFRPSVQPYLVSWFRHDPADALARLDLPALLVYGSTDIQVPVSDGERLRDAGTETSLVVVDGMNHVLKAADGPAAAQMRSYTDPDLPVVPDAVKAVLAFVNRYTPADRDD